MLLMISREETSVHVRLLDRVIIRQTGPLLSYNEASSIAILWFDLPFLHTVTCYSIPEGHSIATACFFLSPCPQRVSVQEQFLACAVPCGGLQPCEIDSY